MILSSKVVCGPQEMRHPRALFGHDRKSAVVEDSVYIASKCNGIGYIVHGKIRRQHLFHVALAHTVRPEQGLLAARAEVSLLHGISFSHNKAGAIPMEDSSSGTGAC